MRTSVQRAASSIYPKQGTGLTPEGVRADIRIAVEEEFEELRAWVSALKLEASVSNLERITWDEGLRRVVDEIDSRLREHDADRRADLENRKPHDI